MNFNDAQLWQMGFGTDLFSAATSNASNPRPPADPAPPLSPGSPLILAIIAPPGISTTSPISISGIASGGSGSVQVAWTSGIYSGLAQGSAIWLIPSVPLSAGSNFIAVTATDSLKSFITSSVTVAYQAPSAPPGNPDPPAPNPPAPNPPAPNPPAPNPPQGPDTTPPSLTILWPATNNYVTTASSLVLAGNATDNIGVVSVIWTTSDGTSGTATGTTNWSTPVIPLYVGATTIVISAADAAGNTTWRSVTVTRN